MFLRLTVFSKALLDFSFLCNDLISESEWALFPGMSTNTRHLFLVTEATAVQQNDSDRTKTQIIKISK